MATGIFLVKSLPLIFYQIKGEQNYDNESEKALYAFGAPDREATVNSFCTLV